MSYFTKTNKSSLSTSKQCWQWILPLLFLTFGFSTNVLSQCFTVSDPSFSFQNCPATDYTVCVTVTPVDNPEIITINTTGTIAGNPYTFPTSPPVTIANNTPTEICVTYAIGVNYDFTITPFSQPCRTIEVIQGSAPTAPTPGGSCDDGDPNTNGDTYDANCNCVGIPPVACSITIPECIADATYTCATLPTSAATTDFPQPIQAMGCTGSLLVIFSDDNTAPNCCGDNIVRTYTVFDDANNDGIFDPEETNATCSQNITIEAPTSTITITAPADITVECDGDTSPTNTGEATADDNGTAVTPTYTDATTTGACGDIITRTWSATDACGNTVTEDQIITLDDTTNPVLTLPADVTISCAASDDPSATGTATGTDNCSNATITHTDAATTGDCLVDGYTIQIVRTWTATDDCGNSVTGNQLINKTDDTPPVLAGVPANITVNCDAIPAVATVTATDDCSGNPTITFDETNIPGGSEDCSNYTLSRTWTATDDCGNSASEVQVIHVLNSFTLTCPADMNVNCDNAAGTVVSWTEPTIDSPCYTVDSNTSTNCIDHINGLIYMGEYGGSTYFCSTTSDYTWAQANALAAQHGGHLAIINSAGENNYISTNMIATESWIGLSDEVSEGTFVWINGDPLTYSNWYSGEPNNTHTDGSTADYVAITKSNGTWKDRAAHGKYEVIIEIPCTTTNTIDGFTLTQTAGPASGSVFSEGTTTISYEATDACGNTQTCSFDITVGTCPNNPPPSYCMPHGGTNYEWIKKIVCGSINNHSGNDGGYGDYTNMSTICHPGQSYNIDLYPDFSGTSYDEFWKVWIDYNRDGDFSDSGEMVCYGHGHSMISKSFTIPSNVTAGDCRMRVSMRWNSYAGPCESISYGEIEDYTINIGGGGGSTGGGSTTNCNNTIDSNDFESGWGIWNDGGADCYRYSSSTYASSGYKSIRLRDNSGMASAMYTDNLNLSAYTSIEICFDFYANSFDNSAEDFEIELSSNGGASWTEVGEWEYSIDFWNNSPDSKCLTINGPFTSTSKLRIKCDASSDGDQVYIDDVVITGCTTSNLQQADTDVLTMEDWNTFQSDNTTESTSNIAPISSVKDVSQIVADFKVFPNPAMNHVQVELDAFRGKTVELIIFDQIGQQIFVQSIANVENNININLAEIKSGVYTICVKSAKGEISAKKLLIHKP